MKKGRILFLAVLLSVFAFTSCNVKSSKVNNFNTDNIIYMQDARTGLCFAIVASRKQGKIEQNGLGVTVVPYEAVKNYLQK